MKSVSERPDPRAWTCQIQTKDGRLLSQEALSRCVQEVGEPFSVRGVEVRVQGRLVEEEGRLLLRLSKTGETLRLAPLRRKVQWDPATKRDHPPTESERRAFQTLSARWKVRRSPDVQIVGPLREENGELLTLEVRQFQWGRK